MILSASRRTDIPAFYGSWFFNRLKAGFCLVRNPVNPNMVGRVEITPAHIDCIVFWTKNPRPIMHRLDELADYPYYFLFTITAYEKPLEKYLPPKKEVIETFKDLARRIGPNRVVWRYDPVMLADGIDFHYHQRRFTYIARALEGFTTRCIISFVTMYQKCQRNLAGFNVKPVSAAEKLNLAQMMGPIASQRGIQVMTCAEESDLSAVGVSHACCIDAELIQTLSPRKPAFPKDTGQRPHCRCVRSVDVGAYHTCRHICLYCYANNNESAVYKNIPMHNPDSPLLLGELTGHEKITLRNSKG